MKDSDLPTSQSTRSERKPEMNTDGVTAELITVTPAIARKMLESNTHNRRIDKNNIKKLSTALHKGEWKVNGEAIKIAADGAILDGQHRLIACVETRISFTTMVIRGLDNTTQDTMDSGRKRTPGDALHLRGYTSTNLLAAIAAGVLRIEQEGLRNALYQRGASYISAPTIVARVEREPGLVEVTNLSYRLRDTMLTGRTFGLLYYVFSSINSEDADDFMNKLASGAGLTEGDPILALRNKLIWIKQQRAHETQVYIGALVIKSWNAYRQGRDLKFLKFTSGGANPEKFPEPR